jgi:hypothetical protein
VSILLFFDADILVARQPTKYYHSTSILSVAGLQKPGSPSLAPSTQMAHQPTKYDHSTSILSVAGLQKPGSPSLAPSTQVAHQPTKYFKKKHVEINPCICCVNYPNFYKHAQYNTNSQHNFSLFFLLG